METPFFYREFRATTGSTGTYPYYVRVKYQEHLTRMTLLQRAMNSENQDAWDEFSSIYEGFILIFLRKFRIPEQESEDITQKVMVKLWKNLSKYDRSKAKFRTWLVTIIRNTSISHMESISKFKHVSAESVQLFKLIEDERQNVLEDYYEAEWQSYIANIALKNVSKHFRGNAVQVFKLALKGKDFSEIASTLNIKEISARNLKNRVKVVIVKEIERLRKELE